MNIFCKHDWQVISDKSETEQEYERRALFEASIGKVFVSEKQIYIVAQCKKCGKLKRFGEEVLG